MKYTILPTLFFLLFGFHTSVTQASSLVSSSSYILLAENSHKSLDSAVNSVKQKTGGRILSAKTSQKNGRRVYKIKVLLPSGKVQTFTINAK